MKALPFVLGLFLLGPASAEASAGRQETKVELSWKFRKGQEFRYRIIQRIVFPGLDLELRDALLMTVTEVSAKGDASMQAKFEGAGIKSTGAQSYQYDSEKDKEPPAHPYTRATAKLIGQTFTFRMSSAGIVSDLQGFDAILREAVKAAGGEQDEALARQFLRQMLSNESMRTMLQQMSLGLPAEKAGKGDKWSTDLVIRFPVIGRVKLKPESRLEELKDGEARIEQDLGIAQADGPDDSPDPLDGLFTVKSGKGKSTWLFAVERGASRSVKLEGDLKLLAPTGLEVPLKIAFALEPYEKKS